MPGEDKGFMARGAVQSQGAGGDVVLWAASESAAIWGGDRADSGEVVAVFRRRGAEAIIGAFNGEAWSGTSGWSGGGSGSRFSAAGRAAAIAVVHEASRVGGGVEDVS